VLQERLTVWVRPLSGGSGDKMRRAMSLLILTGRLLARVDAPASAPKRVVR